MYLSIYPYHTINHSCKNITSISLLGLRRYPVFFPFTITVDMYGIVTTFAVQDALSSDREEVSNWTCIKMSSGIVNDKTQASYAEAKYC